MSLLKCDKDCRLYFRPNFRIVPFGSQNQFSMPVDISLWGKPEHKQGTITRLERSGIMMKVAPDPVGGAIGGPSTSMMYGVVSNKRTFLTPSEVRVYLK